MEKLLEKGTITFDLIGHLTDDFNKLISEHNILVSSSIAKTTYEMEGTKTSLKGRLVIEEILKGIYSVCYDIRDTEDNLIVCSGPRLKDSSQAEDYLMAVLFGEFPAYLEGEFWDKELREIFNFYKINGL